MMPKIALKGVNKSFGHVNNAFVALSDLSFDIRAGEFLAVVGPSGCGKTTVLNMLAGLDSPSSGQILLDGVAISGPGAERGVMFQDYALFPWRTVRGNIEFGLLYGKPGQGVSSEARRKRVDDAIALVGLSGAENKYPHQLSGGMRQRVALGRLVANQPDILLMDEPLAALDAQTRIILQEELLRIWGQDTAQETRRTVMFVTHGIDEAVFLADRVVVLSSHPGRLKAIVDIDLPRPRNGETRKSARFAELSQEIWELIREEAYRATMK
ncbi:MULTISPECIES: ABC transporter ATP-binding protein [unclassified Mesorhizobium]|uniref:ABC transporter ATP-binding protein n=1 Tax=unclassified Mesorhizobium TaxID=325217 RepID=UPI0006F7862E|nr:MULTISPECIES: ABC transporter ATP-binding protein [unclassified Mesorhizobium]KQZ15476.1 ABC transporter ATP-binding protein [Mesorhizobium sp. Root1471]KQZ37985.1 ABC transporter ATP-binding protein [Mesorhizobium sp. Root554]MDR7033341.1 NitT/TauT family transport system ATP-binding protein [Mesorhizobium sp. BE184]